MKIPEYGKMDLVFWDTYRPGRGQPAHSSTPSINSATRAPTPAGRRQHAAGHLPVGDERGRGAGGMVPNGCRGLPLRGGRDRLADGLPCERFDAVLLKEVLKPRAGRSRVE